MYSLLKLNIVYKIISVQKQSSRGALQRICATNMKQTHRRTTMHKGDPKETALQFIKMTPTHTYAPENLQSIRRTPYSGKGPLKGCLYMSQEL